MSCNLRKIIILDVNPIKELIVNKEKEICRLTKKIKYDINYFPIKTQNDFNIVNSQNNIQNECDSLLIYADIGGDKDYYKLVRYILGKLKKTKITKTLYLLSSEEYEISQKDFEDVRITNFKSEDYFQERYKTRSKIATKKLRIIIDDKFYSVITYGYKTRTKFATKFDTPQVPKFTISPSQNTEKPFGDKPVGLNLAKLVETQKQFGDKPVGLNLAKLVETQKPFGDKPIGLNLAKLVETQKPFGDKPVGLNLAKLVETQKQFGTTLFAQSHFKFESKPEQPLNLTCQWWFIRFFETIFGCGDGKLTQEGGTCYLVAFFNSIILSKYVKYLFIKKMKEYIKIYKKDVDLIKYSLNISTSAFNRQIEEYIHFENPELLYVYRILYNVICEKHIFNTFKTQADTLDITDIFSQASVSYLGYIGEDGTKTGGHSSYVMYTILNQSNINFILSLKTDNSGEYRIPIKYTQKDDYRKASDQPEEIFNNFVSSLEVIHEIPLDTDIILYMDNTPKPLDTQQQTEKIKHHKQITKSKFIIETCCLSYAAEAHQGANHSVTGFICNNEYKIYEQSMNKVIDYNWENGLNTNIDYGFTDFEVFRFLRYDYVIYVNSDKKNKYKYKDAGDCDLNF